MELGSLNFYSRTQTSAPLPDRGRISTPVGESGLQRTRTSEASSIRDMLLIEQSHLPSQRRKAAQAGARVIRQDVSIRIAIGPDGKPQAVSGEAETIAKTPEGDIIELRELAFTASLRGLVIARGSAFLNFARRGFPQLQTRAGTFADGLQVEKNRNNLLKLSLNEPFSLLSLVGPDSSKGVLEGFKAIRRTLSSLRDALGAISSADAFSPRTAASSASAVTGASVGFEASVGTIGVNVLQLAQQHRVTSDAGILEAPGLAGSFSLNGVTVSVAAIDTVYDIARTINEGVELVVDSGVFVGGTKDSGVTSEFRSGKLEIQSVAEGPEGIRVTDTDGILASLGIVETVGRILQFKNEAAAAQGSIVNVNSQVVRSDTNTVSGFSGSAKGLTLSLQSVGSATITVSNDPAAVTDRLDSFMSSFNSALDALNIELIRTLNPARFESAGVALKDPAVQGIRVELQRNITAPVPGQEFIKQASDAGLAAARPGRITFSQTTLGSIMRMLDADMTPSMRLAKTTPTVFNALDEIGITAREDGTLSLDKSLFTSVLKNHEAGVRSLFTRAEDGIINRLKSTLDQVLDEKTGVLTMRTAALSALSDRKLRDSFSQALQTNSGLLLFA